MMNAIAKTQLAYNKAVEAVKNKKGQNTVEYLFMLMIIVGVVMLVGGLIKAFMPELFENIKNGILGQSSKAF